MWSEIARGAAVRGLVGARLGEERARLAEERARLAEERARLAEERVGQNVASRLPDPPLEKGVRTALPAWLTKEESLLESLRRS